MKEQFKDYLVEKGFKANTVEDYVNRIVRVCRKEHLSFASMGERIDNIFKQYDNGGIKKVQGDLSHTSVRQAIKHYRSFYNAMNKAPLNDPQTTFQSAA